MPVHYGAATHEALIENVPKLFERYGDDPLVTWHFIDNRGMPEEAREVSAEERLGLLASIDTTDLRGRFNEVLDNAKLTKRDRERFGDQSMPSEFESGSAATEVARYGDRNRIFTRAQYERSQQALSRILNPTKLGSGIDPTALPHLLAVAGYHLEAGSIEFADWSARMINDLGDWVIPHLPELYRRAIDNIDSASRWRGSGGDEGRSSKNIDRDIEDAGVSAGYAPGAAGGSLAATRQASGEVRFRRWRPGDAIDKPLPSGAEPTWDTVRSRYWKNRHAEVRDTNEFSKVNLARIKIGRAPHDLNPRTGQLEPRELHHVIPRRAGGKSVPLNLRELRQDWHSEVDAFRIRRGIRTSRGIR